MILHCFLHRKRLSKKLLLFFLRTVFLRNTCAALVARITSRRYQFFLEVCIYCSRIRKALRIETLTFILLFANKQRRRFIHQLNKDEWHGIAKQPLFSTKYYFRTPLFRTRLIRPFLADACGGELFSFFTNNEPVRSVSKFVNPKLIHPFINTHFGNDSRNTVWIVVVINKRRNKDDVLHSALVIWTSVLYPFLPLESVILYKKCTAAQTIGGAVGPLVLFS